MGNCRHCKTSFCWQCGGDQYHTRGPCIPKKWWVGDLIFDTNKTWVIAPEIVASEREVQATLGRMQNLRDAAARSETSSLGYAKDLTVAAIMQQEGNILQGHTLMMNIHLRLPLEKMKAPAARVDLETQRALADLERYLANLTRFLRDKTSNMQTLKKGFKTSPRRFIDVARQVVKALQPG